MDPSPTIDHRSPAQAKIGLFRSLFRGREDIYARRFESRKTGKHGYAPACANEWVRGVCEKPRVKCAECPYRRFLPLTDDVVRWHLSGVDADGEPFVAGVYPLLPDETCWFLAVDFDKSGWREDVAACLETCCRLSLPAALERSRSGHGAHLWLFFEESIPAALARRLGSHVLTETMESRPELGLDSYDRLFPNQDTMPQGGFGNLIALPLQKAPRDQGNSVFLDPTFDLRHPGSNDTPSEQRTPSNLGRHQFAMKLSCFRNRGPRRSRKRAHSRYLALPTGFEPVYPT